MKVELTTSKEIINIMVQSICHQIKNPLTIIQTSKDLWYNHNDQHHITEECFNAISKSAHRIDQYLNYLEYFLCDYDSPKESFDIRELCHDITQLLRKPAQTILFEYYESDHPPHHYIVFDSLSNYFKLLFHFFYFLLSFSPSSIRFSLQSGFSDSKTDLTIVCELKNPVTSDMSALHSQLSPLLDSIPASLHFNGNLTSDSTVYLSFTF